MDSEVDELDPATGQLVKSPLSRQQPWRGVAGVRVEPPGCRMWGQAEVVWSDHADQLSLRDLTDTRRIPPGGTPSWTVVNLRTGIKLSRRVRASLALENVFDEDYRIHGSGVNEPGRNLVGGIDLEW
jgi:hemoglobin/transferrin/lactoferrin receptor protein